MLPFRRRPVGRLWILLNVVRTAALHVVEVLDVFEAAFHRTKLEQHAYVADHGRNRR